MSNRSKAVATVLCGAAGLLYEFWLWGALAMTPHEMADKTNIWLANPGVRQAVIAGFLIVIVLCSAIRFYEPIICRLRKRNSEVRSEYPSIAGVWMEKPGMLVSVKQSDNNWSAECSYQVDGFGTVTWEMAGTITRNGKISGTLYHRRRPANWDGKQTRQGDLSKDGKFITGVPAWADGGGGAFVWRRESSA